ncbi:saccharopine dehydrogenase family protein [Nocardia pseudovaccinii]|uniref:saccharopine dehydrogenase family protein n=1 Tax=Nocardia pseudovaccinii TaxID=189540 RepID=UPI0007A4AE30|nr:saccharopine dehydrogenase NADP-binding domain-containing protein [Nocardia pseudovaccinii]
MSSIENTGKRVTIVGGAGAMGRWALRTAARLDFIGDLVVADINLERAQQICEEVGAPARAVQLDVTDTVAIRQVFAASDIVLNTMGPFVMYGERILRAAIESGCDYLDIDDDWESTVAALELDAAAKSAGVRVVKGMGASPGLSNLLARAAASELDQVDELYTGWALVGASADPADSSSGPSAALDHFLRQSSGQIRTWQNGGWAEPAPLERIELSFPGLGQHTVYTCGHPEPITLAGNIPVRNTSLNVMSGPDWFFDPLRTVATGYANGELTLGQAGEKLAAARRPFHDALPLVWALATGDGAEQGMSVLATITPSYSLPGRMGGATGIPLAVGLDLLVRHADTPAGVLAPESAFEPSEFFERLADFATKSEDADPSMLSIVKSEGDA